LESNMQPSSDKIGEAAQQLPPRMLHTGIFNLWSLLLKNTALEDGLLTLEVARRRLTAAPRRAERQRMGLVRQPMWSAWPGFGGGFGQMNRMSFGTHR
jgi:hypothetical protein